MKNPVLGIALITLACTWASAETSVWKAQKDGSVMYLGGTCHLLRQSDFPLPPEFDQAYRSSDVLVFETDIGALQDPLTQQLLMTKAMYADGSTIDQHLSSSVYKALSEYCTSNSIPLAAFKHFKPSIIAMTLTTMELMKTGVTREGADIFFYQQAIQDKKPVRNLETIDEQISFIINMGKGHEDELITHTIAEIQTIEQDYEAMVDAWKTGDALKLNELMLSKMKNKTPQIFNELVVDRNENWLPLIAAFRETPEKEFILVGVGHLVGADGIIESLKKTGYTIEKMKTETGLLSLSRTGRPGYMRSIPRAF